MVIFNLKGKKVIVQTSFKTVIDAEDLNLIDSRLFQCFEAVTVKERPAYLSLTLHSVIKLR